MDEFQGRRDEDEYHQNERKCKCVFFSRNLYYIRVETTTRLCC